MSGPPTLETPRLLLRAPRSSDVDEIFAIQGDPDAMRHTYVAPDRGATAAYLDAYSARFAEDGFAPWVAVHRADHRVVGWGGLNRDPGEPHWGVEVAYFIHRRYWGLGLASELVRASLELGLRDLGLPEVIAFARPANHASIRVLTKAGFAFLRFVPELERDQYVVTPDAWKRAVGEPTTSWVVWRQDDVGNRFEVSRGHSRQEAFRLVADYESRGHKQHYWASPAR